MRTNIFYLNQQLLFQHRLVDDLVAKSKALADKLEAEAGEKPAKQPKKREVVAITTKSVESQTNYEKRYYMRNFHLNEVNPLEVRHETSHKLDDIIDKFIMYVATTRKTSFKTGDLIDAFDTCGPSYGDINRSAMRHLKSVHAVSIKNIGSKKRPRYRYDVITTSGLFSPIFAETNVAPLPPIPPIPPIESLPTPPIVETQVLPQP